MIRKRLAIAMTLLATASVFQGAAALWALGVADRHTLHGRVTSDIHVGFVELSATKQRLRTWVSRAMLGADADPAERVHLQNELMGTIAQLRVLSEQAIALGTRLDDDDRRAQMRRLDSLLVLERGVQGLRVAIDGVAPLPAGSNSREAWEALSAVFEVSEGQNLRELIAEGIARASASVTRERAAADRTLRWMRALWLGTALALGFVALLLAWYFARALRRPLTELTIGAEALQRGELGHHIPEERGDEFSKVAHSVNAMAAELKQHRQREIHAREELQDLVDARTTELQNALVSLQGVDARRRQLFADISHELRTPTTAIRGEAEVALRGHIKDTDDYRSALKRIVEVSRQLGLVIDDLLTMAQSDIDALALHKQPLDPMEPLREALQQIAGLAAERGVAMTLHPPLDEPLLVHGDGQRLRQLMLLLLDNAVRYSRCGGAVAVTMAAREDSAGQKYIEMCVADEGIGIAVDELSHVFERHFRGAQARVHRADGTGLGLAIGAVLARAHGGSIAFHSEPAVGTTATLRLPFLSEMDYSLELP